MCSSLGACWEWNGMVYWGVDLISHEGIHLIGACWECEVYWGAQVAGYLSILYLYLYLYSYLYLCMYLYLYRIFWTGWMASCVGLPVTPVVHLSVTLHSTSSTSLRINIGQFGWDTIYPFFNFTLCSHLEKYHTNPPFSHTPLYKVLLTLLTLSLIHIWRCRRRLRCRSRWSPYH